MEEKENEIAYFLRLLLIISYKPGDEKKTHEKKGEHGESTRHE